MSPRRALVMAALLTSVAACNEGSGGPAPGPSPPPPAAETAPPAPVPEPAPAAPPAPPAIVPAPPPSAPDPAAFTPEQFGAKGDGITNDSEAMAKLKAAVNAAGGGTIEFRKAVYIVGLQTPTNDPAAGYAFAPAPLLELSGCTKPLVIRGNGALLRCAPGLRYGVFSIDGERADHPMPYLGGGLATPYRAMISVSGCTAPLEISDFELDGNLPNLVIGGRYGDTGWQIPACGLILEDNLGDETVRNITSHHHGQDGVEINGDDRVLTPAPKRTISGVVAEHNGRQGCSIVGGRGYAFDRCRLAHTGRSAVSSAPAAGLDIEAEDGRKIRDLSFTDCQFVDNAGCGLVADNGDSADVTFTRCTFIGTTNWSAWPDKPNFRFQSCAFVGALTRAWGDDDPARAAQFADCTFADDPKLSPTGAVYGEGAPIADLNEAKQVRFQRCAFNLVAKGLLPWSTMALYEDVTMTQAAAAPAYPRGQFLGTCVITGPVNIADSYVAGSLTINGRVIPPTA